MPSAQSETLSFILSFCCLNFIRISLKIFLTLLVLLLNTFYRQKMKFKQTCVIKLAEVRTLRGHYKLYTQGKMFRKGFSRENDLRS